VTGHVDGVGVIRRFDSDGESRLLEIGQCGALQPYLAPKGSICVDGISLTVVQATPQGFTVAVVPHTLEATSLRAKRAGAEVNLEADLIARYVVNYLKATGKAPNARAFELAGWE
jgi:riboflavin synthase